MIAGRTQGYTLIELLVVLIIVGLSVSLVVPALIKTTDKIRASAEEQKLADVVEAIMMRSFLRQTLSIVELNGRVLQIKKEQVMVKFEWIRFPDQTIIVNGNGFADQRKIKYIIWDKEKELRLL